MGNTQQASWLHDCTHAEILYTYISTVYYTAYNLNYTLTHLNYVVTVTQKIKLDERLIEVQHDAADTTLSRATGGTNGDELQSCTLGIY